jgi:putative oxidoreductase
VARDLGLLVIRLVIGASMLIFHGWGKLSGGPATWERVGGAMENLGLGFFPVVWGFLAAFAEFGGSLLVAVGFLFRPALVLLMGTMAVAVVRHVSLPPDASGAGWSGASHALELLAVYVGLFLTGPGKYALAPRRSRS